MATNIADGLPTPALSSEIQAKPTALSSPMDPDANSPFPFSLPPAAISGSPSTRTPSIASSTKLVALEQTYTPPSPPPSVPIQAKQPASSRRRRSAANSQHNDYRLPPPPTRTRKIIQMKPRAQKEDDSQRPPLIAPNAAAPGNEATIAPALPAMAKKALSTAKAPTAGSKRKQPSSAPAAAAGRKMARKTAHSLIERRRRSKMNEEFCVLKDMIPACAGQEMHKLAILQASIEYMRYLEKCLADLKAAHSQAQSPPARPTSLHPQTLGAAIDSPSTSRSPIEEDSEVVALPSIRHVLAANPTLRAAVISQPLLTSPILPPLTRPSSAQHSPLHRGATYKHLPPPLPDSALLSPAYEHPPSTPVYHSFPFTSPVIAPNDDREATAALLMLNTDRRSWSERAGANGHEEARVSNHKSSIIEQSTRGMSVRDLLTT